MDQEGFEEIADIGELPVGGLRPVFIPGAEGSVLRSEGGDHDHYRHAHIPFYIDDDGRILTDYGAGNNNHDRADPVSGV